MQCRCPKSRRRKAFTLVEVMIGIVLVTGACATMVAIVPLSTAGQVAGNEYLQVENKAQAKLDRLKDLGYGRLATNEIIQAGLASSEMSSTKVGFSVARGQELTFDATGYIEFVDYSADIKQVNIRFDWIGGGAQAAPRTYTLTGLIARE